MITSDVANAGVKDDDFVSFRHSEAWPVLGPYMGRVSPESTVIRPVRGLTYD
jgi:hypothetical protein